MNFYQKSHTVKTQILVNTKTNKIICTAVSKGKVHDFKIWEESQIGIDKKIELLADKGYQGIKVSVHGVPVVFLRSLGTTNSGLSLKIPVDRNPKLGFRSNYVLL